MPSFDEGARAERDDQAAEGGSCGADGPKGQLPCIESICLVKEGRRPSSKSLSSYGPKNHWNDEAGSETNPCEQRAGELSAGKGSEALACTLAEGLPWRDENRPTLAEAATRTTTDQDRMRPLPMV